MPGPAPKPEGTRRRRNATIPMTQLPAGGRAGAPPRWPLMEDISLSVACELAAGRAESLVQDIEACEDLRTRRRLEREHATAERTALTLRRQLEQQTRLEADLWKELWATPVAAEWEKLAWNREVAQYVRWKVQGELGNLNAAKEARAWSDRLGLNPLAMLRLRMEVEQLDPTAAKPKPPVRKRPATGTDDPRAVLRLVK